MASVLLFARLGPRLSAVGQALRSHRTFVLRRSENFCTKASEKPQGRGPLAWYNRQLEKAPITTKSITSGVLFGLGDLIAQFIMGGKDTAFDFKRLGRATVFGFAILGPLAHLHFNFLEYLVVKRFAVRASLMPFAKVFIEQFTYWAISINMIYHFSIAVMEGLGVEGGIERVKTKIIPTMKANYMLWPAVQIINFKLVPLAHQLNFVLIVSIGWAVYLSLLGSKKAEETD
ncbi:uncharacterized protein [Oscarella lobularis]|uniref:uncharacterized protein n=1 Tax=Oscarella lobularis TaxID=121494 RepID=UPI003313AD99